MQQLNKFKKEIMLRLSALSITTLTHASPTSGGVVTLKTGRPEVAGSKPSRAYRPSCSEFSVVSSKTCVSTG